MSYVYVIRREAVGLAGPEVEQPNELPTLNQGHVNGRPHSLGNQFLDHSWSLWLDLQILLNTVPVVLKRTGAH